MVFATKGLQMKPRALVALVCVLAVSGCAGVIAGSMVPASLGGQRPQIQPVPSPKDRLVFAIEEEGCIMTAANVDAVVARAGITREDLRVLTPELSAENRVEVSGAGAIRVLTDRCI